MVLSLSQDNLSKGILMYMYALRERWAHWTRRNFLLIQNTLVGLCRRWILYSYSIVAVQHYRQQEAMYCILTNNLSFTLIKSVFNAYHSKRSVGAYLKFTHCLPNDSSVVGNFSLFYTIEQAQLFQKLSELVS